MTEPRCCECGKTCRGIYSCVACGYALCGKCRKTIGDACTSCVDDERMDFEEESFITADDAFGREG